MMHKWEDLLFSVYVRSGNTAMQLEYAEKLLLRSKRTEYYATIKKTLQKNGSWKDERNALLDRCEAGFSLTDFMDLLSKQKEMDRLLAMVTETPDAIFKYGPKLAEAYPQEAHSCYWDKIDAMAKAATNLKAYKEVCQALADFYNAGAAEGALFLLEKLQSEYKRKSSLVHELYGMKQRMLSVQRGEIKKA
jgi:hypothetical protein